MSLEKINQYAFRVPLLFEGDRGSGKTHDSREFAKINSFKCLEIAGNESVEAFDFLGHIVQGQSGMVWKDGKLTQAFRAAKNGEKIVLIIDEMLRIPQRHLSVLLSALSPDSNDNYRLQTGRMIDVVDGVGIEEEIICPLNNLAIFATTNVGPEFAIDDLDPAVAERFIIIRKDTSIENLSKILQQKINFKSFNKMISIKLVEFFQKTERMVKVGTLNRNATTRTLSRAIELAQNESQVQEVLKDQILLWVDRDSSGKPVQQQVDALNKLIDDLFNEIKNKPTANTNTPKPEIDLAKSKPVRKKSIKSIKTISESEILNNEYSYEDKHIHYLNNVLDQYSKKTELEDLWANDFDNKRKEAPQPDHNLNEHTAAITSYYKNFLTHPFSPDLMVTKRLIESASNIEPNSYNDGFLKRWPRTISQSTNSKRSLLPLGAKLQLLGFKTSEDKEQSPGQSNTTFLSKVSENWVLVKKETGEIGWINEAFIENNCNVLNKDGKYSNNLIEKKQAHSSCHDLLNEEKIHPDITKLIFNFSKKSLEILKKNQNKTSQPEIQNEKRKLLNAIKKHTIFNPDSFIFDLIELASEGVRFNNIQFKHKTKISCTDKLQLEAEANTNSKTINNKKQPANLILDTDTIIKEGLSFLHSTINDELSFLNTTLLNMKEYEKLCFLDFFEAYLDEEKAKTSNDILKSLNKTNEDLEIKKLIPSKYLKLKIQDCIDKANSIYNSHKDFISFSETELNTIEENAFKLAKEFKKVFMSTPLTKLKIKNK